MDKRKHKRSRRFLSALMVLAMLVSLMPAGAFAMDGQSSTPTDIAEQNPANEPGTGEEGNSGTDGTEGTDSTDGTEESGDVTEMPTEPTTPTEPTEPAGDESDQNSLEAVYVSADGSDDDAGTAEKPFATLAKAVDAAADGATVYVMSDLTATTSARYWNKHLTITSGDGGPYTITRGNEVTAIQDPARGGYNGALLEVGGSSVDAASLTLIDITFDDQGKKMGEYFIQADSEGDGETHFGSEDISNGAIVQDGIIATYNGTATIVLGNGAVLKNFGGMSALRLSGGQLTMESGSAIYDDSDVIIDRTKGKTIQGQNDTSLYGPAGAIWMQGGTFIMDEGAIIGGSKDEGHQVIGRAIYIDSGNATVNGTIQNVKGDKDMWQSRTGIAIHLRNTNTEATLGSTGVITEITTDDDSQNSQVIRKNGGTIFTTEPGSQITDCQNVTLVSAWGDGYFDDDVHLNGNISNNKTNWSLIYLFNSDIIFGPSSVIDNNSATGAGGLIYSGNGAHYTFEGLITKNIASNGMVYLANQSGGRVVAEMKDGAKITENTGLGVRVNNSSLFTMNGGEISNNTGKGVMVSGKTSWKGVSFIMNNGAITGNGNYAVDCAIGGDSVVELNGGTISGNNDGDAQLYVWNDCSDAKGVYPDNTNDHLKIAAGVLKGDPTIQVTYGYDIGSFFGYEYSKNRELGTITLDADYSQVGIAYAKHPDTADAIQSSVTAQHDKWTVVGEDAYWLKPSETELHFTVTAPSGVERGRALYAAYIPMNADGTPVADAKAVLKQVENASVIDVTMDDLTADSSYALMFVMSDEYIFKPDDITIYTGGDGTDDAQTSGLPTPTMNESLPDKVSNVTVNNSAVADADSEYLESLFDIEYVDDQGNVIADDKTPGVYRAKIALSQVAKDAGLTLAEDGTVTGLQINGNTVKIADGELTIRFVSDPEDAVNEELTTIVRSEPLTEEMETPEALANGQAIAVIEGTGWSAPNFYTNGSENAELTDVSGVSLFFDELLPPGVGDNTGVDRAQALEDKADTYLGDSIKYPAYEMKYLDLVDKNNGNAWVASDSDITIYWPYPEGTSAETEFRVLHFRGLHREYGAEYTEESLQQQIEESVIEEVTVTNTKHGVSFTLPGNETEGSFSPFALVWAGSEPDPGPGPDPDPTPDPGPAPGPELERGDHYAYIVGYEDDTIRPKNNITRAEVATIFFRLLTDESREAYFTTDQDFTDVNDSAWYANTVATLSNAGILAGYPDGSFRPNDPITRAEFAAIATRFDDLATADSTFTDIDGHWAEDAINAAYGAGWVGGYPDGTFRPNNNITRAEVMSLVNRVLDREVDEDGMLDDMLTWIDNEPGTWYYEAVQEATNSHDYEREDADSVETWTQINEPIDWDKVEDDLLNN